MTGEKKAGVHNVVFDMGGVLVDWNPLGIARRFASNDEDAFLLSHAVFESIEWSWQDARAVDTDTIARSAKRNLPNRLHGLADEMTRHWHERMDMLDATGELIQELKAAGYGIYLLSNTGESYREFEPRIPAIGLFDGKVLSFEEGIVKPDVRIFRLLCDRYHLLPEECLFIDDLEKNIEAAQVIGMRGFVFAGDVGPLRDLLLGGQEDKAEAAGATKAAETQEKVPSAATVRPRQRRRRQ